MKGNATGGILLLLLASFLIAVGASAKTKEIFSLLFSGSSSAPKSIGEQYLEDNLKKDKAPDQSGTPYQPGADNQIGFGFAGEKGANPA